MPAVESLSLIELAAALRSGSLPLEEYLSQMEENFLTREPQVLAFVPEEGRFERLRREAAELEQRFPEPLSRPSLYGVPIGVKDIFHVDGFVTRAGSQLPPKELQGPEAASVTTLRRAGALVFGKSVTTEFAYFGPGQPVIHTMETTRPADRAVVRRPELEQDFAHWHSARRPSGRSRDQQRFVVSWDSSPATSASRAPV